MADNDLFTGYVMGQSEGNSNGSMFGGDGLWGLIIILALLNGGFGFGGGGGGGMLPFMMGGNLATQADVRAAVDQQTLISKLDQQTYGLADSTYALNNTIINGFHGVDNAICTLGYNTQQGFNNIGSRLDACCCDLKGAIKDNTVQGVMNTNTIQRQIADCCCDIEKMNMQSRFDAQGYNNSTLIAIDKLGDRIIGYMSKQETEKLRDELQTYKMAASQSNQNAVLMAAMDANKAEILRRTGTECPAPCFVVNPPTPVTFRQDCGCYNDFAYGRGFAA